MTINAWSAEAYNSSDFDLSIANLANIKANWVTFTVFWFMEKYNSTEIHRRPDKYTASDSSLIHAIQKAHELEMKVTLKPMIDVVDGTWRALIQPTNWTAWFENYRNFINYYATFAKEYEVELFEVGTELTSSQKCMHADQEWRRVINETRTRFFKNITYAANWDSYSIYAAKPQSAVEFWDALDYIGVDAYFPLTDSYNPTVEQLINAWSQPASGWWGTGRNWTNELYLTYNQTGKQIVFTEIGYVSQNGANTQPWAGLFPRGSPEQIDLQEQADCYQAALEVFKDKNWFVGWFWWNWETDPSAGSPGTPDYNWYPPQNKPAQDILCQYYGGSHDIAITNAMPSKNLVCQGYSMRVNVTVENQGIYAETFNVTAYANTTVIGTLADNILASGNSANITFTWNTTGVAKGIYTISANATIIPSETEIGDNAFIDGTVIVVMFGDFDDDGEVDIGDVRRVARAYGSAAVDDPETPWDETENWDPVVDVAPEEGDGEITIADVRAVARHYGET